MTNEKNIVPKHGELVALLKKDQALLLKELDHTVVDVTHMAIGVVTEARELVLAIFENDVVNIKEEVGDMAFYLVGLEQSLEKDYDNYESVEMETNYDVTSLLLQSMNLLEYVKKSFVSNRELEVPSVAAIMGELFGILNAVCNHHGIDYLEALTDNVDKLKEDPTGFF
jgi:NTP pyrophosphatase (non-canonical NTP hydrolase)